MQKVEYALLGTNEVCDSYCKISNKNTWSNLLMFTEY